MNHLTDEQLEEVLLTGGAAPEHLGECQACRQRLSEKSALRNRLKSAIETIHAPKVLEDRILAHITTSLTPPEVPAKKTFPFRLPTWSPWIGLAALLILVFALFFHFGSPSFETTAQAQLIEVHQANLAQDRQMFRNRDPEKLAAYLKTNLGVAPQTPKSAGEITLQGCCVRNFCKKPVATYVLDTPQGAVSIIVIPYRPQFLGMKKTSGCAKCATCTCWVKSLGKVNLAAVRLGDFSYFAVGPLPQEKLNEILMTVYPPGQP